jgi:hypothetical protein
MLPFYILSIFSSVRSRPAHRPYWKGAGTDPAAREKILNRARPEMLLLLFYSIKYAGGPPKPWPDPKIEA